MEWSFVLLLVGACVLGLTHAFEVDHMTAVSTFVAEKPKPREAAMFGIKWAVGHGFSLLIIGTVLYFLRLSVSDTVATSLERLVGVALLVLGIWTLKQLRVSFLGHTHSHKHTPEELALDRETAGKPHTHADGTTHSHSHDSLWMGMLHGAAGTAAFVGQTVIAVSQSYWTVFAYTLSFSFGVLLAMGAYAAALGTVLSIGDKRATSITYGVRALTGVWACVVGIYWAVR